MTKWKVYPVLSMVFILFTAMTCGESFELEEDQLVYVENQSSDTIYVHTDSPGYENTPWLQTIDRIFKQNIEGKDATLFLDRILPYETIETRTVIRSEKTYWILTVFKASTLRTYTIEELSEKDIFDKRMVYTFGELKNKNYEVIYKEEETQ